MGWVVNNKPSLQSLPTTNNLPPIKKGANGGCGKLATRWGGGGGREVCKQGGKKGGGGKRGGVNGVYKTKIIKIEK